MVDDPPQPLRLSGIGLIPPPNEPADWVRLVGLIGTRLLEEMPTEQDHWWFLTEQYDRITSYHPEAVKIIKSSPVTLHSIEYEGRRSEDSYVGQMNPGVELLGIQERELASRYNASLAQIVVANVYVSYATTCQSVLNEIRMKHAVHFHNNCIASKSFSFADEWMEVIESLGGE